MAARRLIVYCACGATWLRPQQPVTKDRTYEASCDICGETLRIEINPRRAVVRWA